LLGLLNLGRASVLLLRPYGDAVAFYMVLPKVIASAGILRPLPCYEAFTQIGLLEELHFAALMCLGLTDAAKGIVFYLLLSIVALLVVLGSMIGLKRCGKYLLIAFVLSSTTVTLYVGDGKVDLAGAAFGLAAICCICRTDADRDWASERLAGLFAGWAVIAKVSLIVSLMPCLLALVIWRHWGGIGSLKRIMRASSVFLCWTLLATALHVVKNAWLFQEPLAPFVLFHGGQPWTEQAWFDASALPRLLVTYPLALVFGQYPMQGGGLSPLFLLLAPFALLSPPACNDRGLGRRLFFATLIGILAWVIARPCVMAPRYVLPVLLLLSLPVVRGAEYVLETEGGFRWLSLSIWVTVAASLLLTSNRMGCAPDDLIGSIRQPELHATHPTVTGANWFNRHARSGDRVFAATYYRYWWRADLLQTCSNQLEKTRVISVSGPAQFWEGLFAGGFRFLVYDELTHRQAFPFLSRGLACSEEAPPWLRVTLRFRSAFIYIYELETTQAVRQPTVETREVTPGRWCVVPRTAGVSTTRGSPVTDRAPVP